MGWDSKLDSKLAALVGQLNRSSDWAEVPDVVMLAFIEVTDLFREQTIALKDLHAEVKMLRSSAALTAGGSAASSVSPPPSSPSNKDGMLDTLSALQRESHTRHRRTRSRAAAADAANGIVPQSPSSTESPKGVQFVAGSSPHHIREDSSDSVIRTDDKPIEHERFFSAASQQGSDVRHKRAPSVKELANVFEKIAIPVKISHPTDREEDDLIFSPSPTPQSSALRGGRKNGAKRGVHFGEDMDEEDLAHASSGKEKRKGKSKGVRFAEKDNVNVYSVSLADFESEAKKASGAANGVASGGKNHGDHEIIFVFEGDEDPQRPSAPGSDAASVPEASTSPGTSPKKKKKNVHFTMGNNHVLLYDHQSVSLEGSNPMHDTGGEPLSANDAEKLGFGDRAKSILGLSSSGSKDRVQHPGRDELKSEDLTSSLDSILEDIKKTSREEDDRDPDMSLDHSPATTSSPGSDLEKLDTSSPASTGASNISPGAYNSKKKKPGRRLLKVFMRRKGNSHGDGDSKADDSSSQGNASIEEEELDQDAVSPELAMLINMLANT